MTTITITLKGFIHTMPRQPYDDPKGPRNFVFFSYDASDHGYLMVGPASFDYTLPQEWNPQAAEVTSLEKQKEAIAAECQKKLASINKRLAELQCIEFDAGDAS